jgi:hypothetical protein
MANSQIIWLVKKGDLITKVAGEAIIRNLTLEINYKRAEKVRNTSTITFVASQQEDRPTRFSDLPREEQVVLLHFNLVDIPSEEEDAQNPPSRVLRGTSLFREYLKVKINVKIRVGSAVTVTASCGTRELVTKVTQL